MKKAYLLTTKRLVTLELPAVTVIKYKPGLKFEQSMANLFLPIK